MSGESNLDPALRRRDRTHAAWRRAAELAASQLGIVERHQLLALGLSPGMVDRACADGRLHRIHPGVYAMGHRHLTKAGRRFADVLASGPAAVLSHRPAGDEWGVRGWNGRSEVIVPRWRPGPSGVLAHTAALEPDEITTTEDGLAITTVTRTLLDLASVLDDHAMSRALEEAWDRQLRSPVSLPALMTRHAGNRGVGRLRRVMAAEGYGLGVTRRELEELFIGFIAETGLPHPELNQWLPLDGGGLRPDCIWRRQRVIVELQSYERHKSRQALTRDAGKFRRLSLLGYVVVAVTWKQLVDRSERHSLERDLARLIADRP